MLISALISINLYINSIIRYQSDTSDYWQTPLETLEYKTGDCEDIAILKWWIAKEQGIDLKLALVRTEGANHLIAISDTGEVLNNSDSEFRIIAIFDENYVWMDGKRLATPAKKLFPNWEKVLDKIKNDQ